MAFREYWTNIDCRKSDVSEIMLLFFLFYYILLSNVVVVTLMGVVGAEVLLFDLCVINSLVTVGGVGGYVLYQIHKLELAQIEVTEEQRIPMQRKYAVRCALSGIGFGVLMTILKLRERRNQTGWTHTNQ